MAGPIVLIDADSIAYASAVVLEPSDSYYPQFMYNQVGEILEACKSSNPPIIYLTGADNFRYDIATVKPYKGGRAEKPYHLPNARACISAKYNSYTSRGCEADDLLTMSATSYREEGIDCVIASIDKDLRQQEGWHYSWETHNAPERPLYLVDKLGELNAHYKTKTNKAGKESEVFHSLSGSGYLWFLAQALTGDTTDNIPGLAGVGGKGAYTALHEAGNRSEGLSIVSEMYREKYGEDWRERCEEQLRLVWMIRERNEDGSLKHFNLKDNNYAGKN